MRSLTNQDIRRIAEEEFDNNPGADSLRLADLVAVESETTADNTNPEQ